jgi:hypothetical protein
MTAPSAVVQAVQAAIVASAHMTAHQHVAAAARACSRLGSLTSGRWRAAARELARLEEDLQTATTHAAEAVAERAVSLGVHDEALWTAGDAAATLDLLREYALDEVDEDSRAAKLLQGQVLFGTSFVEDPDVPDRGTTLLFGWPEPLSPASWPWQANWIVSGDAQDGDATEEELDLFETGELEGDDSLLAELADELSCSRSDARVALREAALALTRATLLAGDEDEDEDEDEDDGEATNANNNGGR